ncbi:hypothetical protein V5F79_03365 [Xanthobacter flavus]|uniref:hypothetical protein n=1 Tax=Xanthobacter flavus TaxID=281 RepID=UPI003729C201
MAETFTSASQTAAIREEMAASVCGRPAAPSPSLPAADAYLLGGGLQQVTTLTQAAFRRGAAQITCDTDVMLLLCLLAAEALDARAPKMEGVANG